MAVETLYRRDGIVIPYSRVVRISPVENANDPHAEKPFVFAVYWGARPDFDLFYFSDKAKAMVERDLLIEGLETYLAAALPSSPGVVG